MPEEYVLFRFFPERELAEEMKELLEEEGIACVLGDNIPPFDLTFSGNTTQHRYEVRIPPSEFERAEGVLDEWADNLLYDADREHYLYEFSEPELLRILSRPDEWSPHDYALARKILQQRGVLVDIQTLRSLRQKRLRELSRPEENQKIGIVLAYVLALFGGALGLVSGVYLIAPVCAFVAALIGYFLWKTRKTLPNGERIYAYADEDRRQGRRVLIVSVALLPVYLILGLIRMFIPY